MPFSIFPNLVTPREIKCEEVKNSSSVRSPRSDDIPTEKEDKGRKKERLDDEKEVGGVRAE